MRNFKIIQALVFSSAFTFLPGTRCIAQTVVLTENFTSYAGTAATVPPGWNFSYNGAYTTVASCGTSGPNAYKFGINNAAITTPAFSNADSVKFWIKGQGTDALSSLTIQQTADNINWTTVSVLGPLPSNGTNYTFGINTASIALKMLYTKSAGNLAFDDFSLIANPSTGGTNGKITAYFNHPVNNAVSSGVNAIYLNNAIDDTLVAYINRAKFTIDLAVYNYTVNAGDSMNSIANAINAAYARGVTIRWIHDGSTSNTGLPLLNAAIPTLGSPTTGSYNIMHNKFVIIDANSANAGDAMVWTGSCNFSRQQILNDYNNVIIFQDQNLALAYQAEFNQMWGSTTTTPNLSNSKFGPFKTNLGQHNFVIGGVPVELYFSPSDGTNNQIKNAINSANSDLHFGVYTFTDTSDANAIKAKINAGLVVNGIMDNNSQPFQAYSILNPAMGAALRIFSVSNYLYHNKMLIVDESNSSSDPIVLTGSHNWTALANTKNDENTLIIHSAVLTNIYYQSFCQNFATLGGTACNAVTAVAEVPGAQHELLIYPNPGTGEFTVHSQGEALACTLVNSLGQVLEQFSINEQNAFTYPLKAAEGIYYLYTANNEKEKKVQKVIVVKP